MSTLIRHIRDVRSDDASARSDALPQAIADRLLPTETVLASVPCVGGGIMVLTDRRFVAWDGSRSVTVIPVSGIERVDRGATTSVSRIRIHGRLLGEPWQLSLDLTDASDAEPLIEGLLRHLLPQATRVHGRSERSASPGNRQPVCAR